MALQNALRDLLPDDGNGIDVFGNYNEIAEQTGLAVGAIARYERGRERGARQDIRRALVGDLDDGGGLPGARIDHQLEQPVIRRGGFGQKRDGGGFGYGH